MKRAFDVLLAIVLLWILALPMLFIALAMRTTQGRGILFRQQRMGRHGLPFDILKFRTMRPEEVEKYVADQKAAGLAKAPRNVT